MKRGIILVMVAMIMLPVFAQKDDAILTISREQIVCRVLNVDEQQVQFVLAESDKSDTAMISLQEVSKIFYADGRVVDYNSSNGAPATTTWKRETKKEEVKVEQTEPIEASPASQEVAKVAEPQNTASPQTTESTPSQSIQITEKGKAKAKTKTVVDSLHAVILQEEDGFYFYAYDYACYLTSLIDKEYFVKVFMGKTRGNVLESAAIIEKWFKKAKNDEYIMLTNPDGQQVCLYKFNANIYISKGSGEDCRKRRVEFGKDIAYSFTGIFSYIREAENKDRIFSQILMGNYKPTSICSFKYEFQKAVKKFKEAHF